MIFHPCQRSLSGVSLVTDKSPSLSYLDTPPRCGEALRPYFRRLFKGGLFRCGRKMIWIPFIRAIRGGSIALLLSFMLMFGAIASAALTCCDDTSIEDDVIEQEAVTGANANASLIRVSVYSRLSTGLQRQPATQIRACDIDLSNRSSASPTSAVLVLRI